MAILAPHSDRAVQEYRHRSGARDTYWLNELVKYVRSEGLYNNFRLYPLMPNTNADSGSTAFGLGGLTSNEGTIINGATWTANGLQFVSSSSQYMTIPDFLGSETLTVFARVTPDAGSESSLSTVFGQFDTGLNDRSFVLFYRGDVAGDPYQLTRSDDGTALASHIESYQGGAIIEDVDLCLVAQWVDGGARSFWQNKSAQSLTLSAGDPETSRENSAADITLSADLTSGNGQRYADQTAHALAFVTGTLTNTQRETITDLINMIGKPPPLEALREYVAETGATDTLTLDRLTRYVSDEGLWDNFALYSMMPDTNYNSGSSVKVLGGLTANDMTLVNGPTWGASGLAFSSASSQYGSIADFLGSETLTVFARVSVSEPSGSAADFIVSQYDSGLSERSFAIAAYGGANIGVGPTDCALLRSSDGSSVDIYSDQNITSWGVDTCKVAQWIDVGGRNAWINKTAESLSLVFGTSQTSKLNTSVDITISANLNSGTPTNFTDQTVHALAVVTGTLTTAQRENITDLINEL